jgi:Zn-dependent protease with chaperone function
MLIALGCSLADVQHRLDHRKPDATLRIYTHQWSYREAQRSTMGQQLGTLFSTGQPATSTTLTSIHQTDRGSPLTAASLTATFSAEERERARRYHRPLYRALFGRLLLVLAVYGVLAGRAIAGLGWAGDAASWAAVVVISASLVCLPLDFWRGYLYERRWRLSTQTLQGWLGDRAKAGAVTVALAAAAWTTLVGIAQALPSWWLLPAMAGAALLVVMLTLLAPLLLEPLFNRFEPLADAHLAQALRELAEKAGVPIREVLVADASRRTRKSNAYVSGLGPTRRLVVWDTLLRTASEQELKLIVAHELAHRRERHILKSTLLATFGAVLSVLLIWAALCTPKPGDFPYAALLLLGLELVGLPFGAALSRHWERIADRYSLELTGDSEAFIRTHLALARTNIADLDPPRLAYLALFTHPTPPERIALATSPVA